MLPDVGGVEYGLVGGAIEVPVEDVGSLPLELQALVRKVKAAVEAHDDLRAARDDDADLAVLSLGNVLRKDINCVVVGVGTDSGVGVCPAEALCDDWVYPLQHQVHLGDP